MSKRMYEDLCDMLKTELNAIVKKGEITKETLDNVHKLISSIDKTKHLIKEEEGGASNTGYSQRYYRDGGSYDYVHDGGSYGYTHGGSYDEYAHGRRGRDGDGDGRYSEDYSGRRIRDAHGRYTNDGYSGADDKHQMVDKLRRMMNETSDQQTKIMIQDCIRGIEG